MTKQSKEKPRHRPRRQQILTDGEVGEIRATYKRDVDGSGYQALARRFGVSPSQIKRIVLRTTRANVE